MTPLDSEVTRLTTILVDGREVDVTLRPANPATLDPECVVFHQKGLRNEKAIPLPAILNAIGWKVQIPKKQDAAAGFDQMMTELEKALSPWKESA